MIALLVRLSLALVIAAGGVLLASCAEADDSPGGVLIGWLVVIGGVTLGAKAFRRKGS